jgi:hypothetical protein
MTAHGAIKTTARPASSWPFRFACPSKIALARATQPEEVARYAVLRSRLTVESSGDRARPGTVDQNAKDRSAARPSAKPARHHAPDRSRGQARSFLLAAHSSLPFHVPSLLQASPPAFEHRAASFAWSSTCPCLQHPISSQYGCPG